MKKILFIILVLCAGLNQAQIPERPQPPRLYNNLSKEFPDFLNTSEAAALEEKLEVFANQTSNQICVVIVDDLGGYESSDYSFRLGNQWGVGKKDLSNGIVVLVKPTKNDGGRDLFIAVGYGLEGAIPDLATKRIREQEIEPLLKEGRFYEALDRGTDVLMKLAKGEINVQDYTRTQNPQQGHAKRSPLSLLIIVIVVLIILRSMFRGGGGGSTISRAGRSIFWGSMLGGGFGRGGGGWSGGGGGGGGWGGFGGGSFGGGGSGGKW